MEKKELLKQIEKARKRVDSFDKIDKIKDRDPLTIWSALECGLSNNIGEPNDK